MTAANYQAEIAATLGVPAAAAAAIAAEYPLSGYSTVMKSDWTNLAKFGTPGFGCPRFTSSGPQWQSLVPPGRSRRRISRPSTIARSGPPRASRSRFPATKFTQAR